MIKYSHIKKTFNKDNQIPEKQTSSDGNFSWQWKGNYIEPNNGWELQEFAIFHKEEDITFEFFDKNYSQLFKSSHFHFSNPDGRFLYMPQMYESILYDTKTRKKYILPETSLNNIFLNNRHGIFFIKNKCYIIDLMYIDASLQEVIFIDEIKDWNNIYIKDEKLFFLILEDKKILIYTLDISLKQIKLHKQFSFYLPNEIFSSSVYKTYEDLTSLENYKFTFSIGYRPTDHSEIPLGINSWKVIEIDIENKSMILGTYFPTFIEKEIDRYSYTYYWIIGKNQYIKLKMN